MPVPSPAEPRASDAHGDGGPAFASASRGKFAFLLGDRLLCDCQLVLKRPQKRGSGSLERASAPHSSAESDAVPEPSADGSVLEVISVHSTVMCANSPYFRAKLLGSQPGAAPSGSPHPQQGPTLQPGGGATPGPDPSSSSHSPGATLQPSDAQGPTLKVLEELLTPEDLPAMRSVLRFMYTEVLDYRHGVHSPVMLVDTLRIADRFQVTDCVSVCCSEFAKLKAPDLDVEMLRMVFLIDAIASGATPAFAGVLEAVTERLLELFRDVVAVVRSPTLLAHFLTLPFAAVAALLRSDRVVTDSENSVLVLASLWVCRSPMAQYCTAEQLRYIAGCIRLGLLTPSYLCGVLPNIRWFAFAKDAAGPYFQALQARLIPTQESRTLLQAQGQKVYGAGLPGMVQPRAPTKEQVLELTLEIEEKSLAEYLKAGHLQLLSLSSASGTSVDTVPPSAGSTPPSGTAGSPAAAAGGMRGVQVNSETTFFSGYLFGIKLVFGHTSAPTPTPGAGSGAGQAASAASSSSGPGAGTGQSATPTAASGEGSVRGMFRMGSARKAAPAAAAPPGLGSGDASANGSSSGSGGGGGGVAADAPKSGVVAGGEPRLSVTPSVFATLPPGEEALLPLSTPINVCFRCSLEAMGPYGTPFAAATFTGGSFMKPGEEAESSVAVSNFFRKVGPTLHDIAAWQPFLCDGKLKLKLVLQGATLE